MRHLLLLISGGRPMTLVVACCFQDLVSGRWVHLWIDARGRHWLAESRWSLFRVESTCVAAWMDRP